MFEKEIGFNNIKLIPKNQKDLFIDLSKWNESLIRIQKDKNLYKLYAFKKDESLQYTMYYTCFNIY